MHESWLPIGFALPDGMICSRAIHSDANWQIVETQGGGRALISREKLATAWVEAGLLEDGAMQLFTFGEEQFCALSSEPSQELSPVAESKGIKAKSEALAFATSLKATRAIDGQSSLQDAIYFEKISRLLPSYGIAPKVEDEVILGYWLTGGARVSVKSVRRLEQMLSWLEPRHLRDVIDAAGFAIAEIDRVPGVGSGMGGSSGTERAGEELGAFALPGRPELERFFNEHVVDIIQHAERYRMLGIEFPSAVVLHGPPGCGKTFAVEQLTAHLGWPSFQIDASSVGSPYIHETSRKVAEVFENAMKAAPSLLVIDEMEAFLADRQIGIGASHHRVEEVAEFLRRIPEAAKNKVLVIAMTNRLEMIDAAILRRGRFDHVLKVDFATEAEVRSLLDKLLSGLPIEPNVNPGSLASQLVGRPLSDVAFVVREGARLSARAGKDRVAQEFLSEALREAPSRTEESSPRRVGFI